MKKIYFCFLLLLSFIVSTHAQYRYGIEGGMNMSYTAVNPEQGVPFKTSMLIAYRAGGLLDFAISDKIGLQVGLYYTVLGYKYSYSQTIGSGSVSSSVSDNATVKENFLRLPINVLFKRPLGSGTLFINVGPFVGYGLNGTVSGKLHSSVSNGSQTQNSDSSYKSNISYTNAGGQAIDYGLNAGIGYELPIGLFIRAGYELSVSAISAVDGFGTQTNNCFNISLGFLLVHRAKERHISFNPQSKHHTYNHLVWPQ